MEHLLFVYLITVFYIIKYTCGYIETVDEYGCEDTEFRLTCRHLDSHITILEAYFYPNDPEVNNNVTSGCTSSIGGGSINTNTNTNTNNNNSGVQNNVTVDSNETISVMHKDYSAKNIRLSLMKRCSGVNHCSYRLPYDTPGGQDWGAGLVQFKYLCIAARRVTKYCNVKILLNSSFSEGFIQSPGYPQFYVGDLNCNWKILAPKGQLIQIMLVDVSLRVNYAGSVATCVDQLTILENNRSIFSSCEEKSDIDSILSTESTIDINLEIKSKTMFPQRGILLYYKGIGCPTLESPIDGYLVARNDTIAEYMCNVGFMFPDTKSRVRQLRCVGGNAWHTDLPDCTSMNSTNSTNIIDNSYIEIILPTEPSKMAQEANIYADYIIPILIILMLFIVNGIVVYVIYRQRKRALADLSEEELAVIN